MTISISTPMRGPVDSDAATIAGPFLGHAYDDATVQRFAAALVANTALFGLVTSIVAAQIAKETGFFRFGGQVQPEQFNLAGLGSTNGGAAGLSYPDIETGTRAVCVHHMTYIYGDVSNWPAALQQYKSLDQRYDAVLSTGNAGKVNLLADYTNGRWAYTSTIPIGSLDNGYATGIAALANTFTQGGPVMVRIIVSAGHEHIGSITSDPNGVINPANLRGQTGANGEVQWTVACADALVQLLRAAGVDAVRTDSIYHSDVYGPDADLALLLHYDGGAGTGRAQYCMAATVHSGPSTTEADARADSFVADWYKVYCAQTGIAGDGPITVDMTQEYSGWYRNANTPMAILEHCLGADAAGQRSDRPTPEQGAAANFAAIAQHFNLNGSVVPPAASLTVDGHPVGQGFYDFVQGFSDPILRFRALGACTGPEHDEYIVSDAPFPLNKRVDPVRAVRFERNANPLIWDHLRTPAPWDVRFPLATEYVGPADDPLISSILHAMELSGVQ